MDAGKLEYISSAGLRVLLKIRKTCGQDVEVINVSHPDKGIVKKNIKRKKEIKTMLNIEKKAENSVLTVLLTGRLDTTTAPELEKEIKGSLDGVTKLVIDTEKLEYISSAGLRVLLAAQKIMGKQGSMKVLHVSETIMEIFDVTGFADILTIE